MNHLCAITHVFFLWLFTQSSPQILLTTTFIVRATTTQSPIVYISLLTSLWSLCSRVATDDKQLFTKAWHDMIIFAGKQQRQRVVLNRLPPPTINYDGMRMTKRLDKRSIQQMQQNEPPKKGCKINFKWIKRVLCWRFLEISSRICLFALVWLNLGGMAVFIILFTEFVYLIVLCYGLRTFS